MQCAHQCMSQPVLAIPVLTITSRCAPSIFLSLTLSFLRRSMAKSSRSGFDLLESEAGTRMRCTWMV